MICLAFPVSAVDQICSVLGNLGEYLSFYVDVLNDVTYMAMVNSHLNSWANLCPSYSVLSEFCMQCMDLFFHWNGDV